MSQVADPHRVAAELAPVVHRTRRWLIWLLMLY